MTSPLLPSHRAIGSRSTSRNEVFPERGVVGGGPLCLLSLESLELDWLPLVGKYLQVSGVFLVLRGEAGTGKWGGNNTRNKKGKNY